MKVRVWSPLPPTPSGIADYVAEQLPALAARADVEVVVEDPTQVDPALRARFAVVSPLAGGGADVDLYHVGNSPSHAYVYRRALAHPGVVMLHDWSLHHLVLHETLEQGDVSAYLREMRRAHGETGTFVGRQVARALGGDVLPALFPLNDRLLEASLAVIALTGAVARRVQRRLPERPVLHLAHHLALPLSPLPTRSEARQLLGLPADAFVITAPGLATANKRTDAALRALARLDARAVLVVAGGQDARFDVRAHAAALGLEPRVIFTGRVSLPDFLRHLCAADAVLCLRFPSHGEMSGALVRALGVGRAVLVTAGTPAAEELPPGVAVPVDPGAHEEAELAAFLRHLMTHPETQAALERQAGAYARAEHDLEATVVRLVAFLEDAARARDTAVARLLEERPPADGLLGYFMEEIQWGARDLGLVGMRLGLEPLLRELAGGPA